MNSGVLNRLKDQRFLMFVVNGELLTLLRGLYLVLSSLPKQDRTKPLRKRAWGLHFLNTKY